MQKISLVVLIVAASFTVAFSQNVPEPIRFEYHFTGTVTDEFSVPMAGMFVCFWPAERPISGRIFCAKTEQKGNYNLTVHDIPDKYVLTASTLGASSFVQRKGVINRIKNSETLVLGPHDESRNVDIRMDPIKPADVPSDATCSGTASNGLRLCTTDDLISGNSGADIALRFFIRNPTEESIVVRRQSLKYTTSIINSKGEPVLTRCEAIDKEAAGGQLTRSQIECIPIFSGPSEITFIPKEDRKQVIVLTADRPLLAKGRYVVYLYLSLKSPDGVTDDKLSLGPISFEIK